MHKRKYYTTEERADARRRKRLKRLGTCKACLAYARITRHHVLPKRWYKRPQNAPIVRLCHNCHGTLETVISKKEGYPQKKLSSDIYFDIAESFLITTYATESGATTT